MSKKDFGHISGVAEGSVFPDRKSLREAGIHLPLQAGIHGTKADGADSIVISGGYVDDKDLGDEIIYTGAGGNDPNTRKQVAHQTVDSTYNAGLIKSQQCGHPVRVVRGSHQGSPHSPKTGYRYDGLFTGFSDLSVG